MQTLAEWTEHTPAEYRRVVETSLWSRFGASVDSLHAETAVRACQLAGLSPAECFRWLARVDGL